MNFDVYDNNGNLIDLDGWTIIDFREGTPHPVKMVSTHAGIIPDQPEQPVADNGKKCGIFADEMPQSVITRAYAYHLDMILLCGNETATLIQNLKTTLDPDIRRGIRVTKASTTHP